LEIGVLGLNFFPVNLPPLSTSGNFAHTVKIYADPASIIGLNTNGSGGAFNCVATFSGQLVDVP
jgi:hypothetical protein